jgi:hypothetical protein
VNPSKPEYSHLDEACFSLRVHLDAHTQRWHATLERDHGEILEFDTPMELMRFVAALPRRAGRDARLGARGGLR